MYTVKQLEGIKPPDFTEEWIGNIWQPYGFKNEVTKYKLIDVYVERKNPELYGEDDE